MELDIDFESEELLNELNEMAKNTPKLIKKHFKKVGKNMTTTIKKTAKGIVKVGKVQKIKTKKYHNRFKTSKILEDIGTYAVGTYNSSPHAHLIEYGYKKKNNKGFVSGKYPIKKGLEKYNKEQLKQDLEEMLKNVIKDGGF